MRPAAAERSVALRSVERGSHRHYDQTDPPSDWSATVSFQGPTQAREGAKESWTLKCLQPNGRLHSLEQVQVARGERADVGKTCQQDKQGKGTLLR